MQRKYKNLFIIGNGFDRWQGLSTSYEDFRRYYYNNIERILDDMHIEPETVTMTDGTEKKLTPVELIYGNIFHPDYLQDKFFWNFETSTAQIDDQLLNLYFGTSDEGLFNMQETIRKALEILQRVFGEWIASLAISATAATIHFDDSCYFINFNYTDTLEKRFGIDEKNVYFIHGSATDPESMIFGHATHPEMAFPELMEQKMVHSIHGGKSKRLMGLYLAEDALYETDKHVMDNLDDLCEAMALAGVHIEDIENIYVLGHSFGDPDFEYFDFLNKATRFNTNLNTLSPLWEAKNEIPKLLNEEVLMAYIEKNLLYAQRHRQWGLGVENLHFPEEERIEQEMDAEVISKGETPLSRKYTREEIEQAVHMRFLMEQTDRTREVMDELAGFYYVKKYPRECCSVLALAKHLDGGHGTRIKNAHWHISCFSEQDRQRVTTVMQKIGCKKRDYTLYAGIDECLAAYLVR